MTYLIARKKRFDRLFSFWLHDSDLEFLDLARPEEITVAEYLRTLISAERERKLAEGWRPGGIASERPAGGLPVEVS